MNKATVYTYLLWLGLAVGYPLLQVWVATTMGWVGTPEQEFLASASTRLPLLGLLLVTYRRTERQPEPHSDAVWVGGAFALAIGLALAWLIFSKRALYLAEGASALIFFLFSMLIVAATEEYLFRGHLLLARLEPGRSSRRPFLLSTLAFAGVHAVNGLIYAGSSWSGIASQMIYALLVGALLGWLALQLRRVWPLVLLHAGLNIGLATARLREPVFTPDSSLSAAALAVMVGALALAAFGALGRRKLRTASSERNAE